MHDFLVIGRENSTMILATGEELSEITDKVDMHVTGPTLDIANVCERQRVIQVYSNRVLLLNGGNIRVFYTLLILTQVKKLHEVTIDGKILGSSIVDKYVLLRLKDSTTSQSGLALASVKDDMKSLELTYPTISKGPGTVTASSLFVDQHGIFSFDQG